jgi:hypothetical protein
MAGFVIEMLQNVRVVNGIYRTVREGQTASKVAKPYLGRHRSEIEVCPIRMVDVSTADVYQNLGTVR